MATFYLFDEVVLYIFEPSAITAGGPIDFETDAFKVALTNSAPTQDTYDTLSDVTQITAQNGYSSGGNAAANPAFAETGAGTGIWQFTTDDVIFTASGGDFAAFQYPVLYDDDTTTPADILIGYLNYGSTVNLTSGNTFTVNVGANGWFQITVPNFA